MNWIEWCKMVEDTGISTRDAVAVTQYLHDLGEIIYFNDKKNILGLNEVVILEPQWLTEVMSTVITMKKNWVDNGVLLHRNLVHLWKAPNYPVEIHEKLLNLLELFELAFELPQIFNMDSLAASHNKSTTPPSQREKRILIASLLPEERPATLSETWDTLPPEPNSLIRIYVFKFLPVGFMSRLIVRTLHFIEVEALWRHGILMKKDTEQALMVVESKFQRIRIQVRGETPVRLLYFLTDNIENLAEGWLTKQNRVQQVQIPCPNCLKDKVNNQSVCMFTLNQCEDAVSKGIGTVECNSHVIRIDQIAPDVTLADIDYIEFSSLKVDKQIGAGGFASVYKATTQTGEVVAVKQLDFQTDKEILTADQILEKLRDFRREVIVMR